MAIVVDGAVALSLLELRAHLDQRPSANAIKYVELSISLSLHFA